jgi:hypothetical protein
MTGILHKTFASVIPTLLPFNSLRETLICLSTCAILNLERRYSLGLLLWSSTEGRQCFEGTCCLLLHGVRVSQAVIQQEVSRK